MGLPSIGGIALVRSRIEQIEARISGGLAQPPAANASVSSGTSATGTSSSGASFAALYQAFPTYASTTSTAAPTEFGGPLMGGPNDELSAVIARSGIPAGTPYASEFAAAGERHGVPAQLLAAIGWVESRYRPDAVSPDGALGVMQIMPTTAKALGVDPRDPQQAIDGAARYLADGFRRFGSWDLAVASYLSGAGAVARNGNQATPGGAAYADRVARRLEETSA